MREQAILAGGCFWCIEAMFASLTGVEAVESGYTGGHVPNPTYEAVCTGTTGHAEAIRITYDPRIVAYGELLDLFFAVHDPTQLNRQGNDVGPQYRSAIFPLNDAQSREAEAAIARAQADHPAPVVTRIEAAGPWYSAEDYHQRYFELLGSGNSYCQTVVAPKIAKFRKRFADRLKPDPQ